MFLYGLGISVLELRFIGESDVRSKKKRKLKMIFGYGVLEIR